MYARALLLLLLPPLRNSPPKNMKQTASLYRMYIVVSPDTTSFTRVGYGFQEQLVFASSLITVEEEANLACPEIVGDVTDTASSARPRVAVAGPAKRASAVMAASLAAAAAATASARA